MKIIVLCLVLIIVCASCTISRIPNNDALIEQQIVDAAKANDRLYLELLAAPLDKRGFDDFAKEYIEIGVEINSIKLKNGARKKNTDMMTIINVLSKHFNEYEKEHKNAKKPLSDAMIVDYENDINAFWKALYLSEKGLPHATTNN